MKEIKLSNKDLSKIRSDAISEYTTRSSGEYAHITSIINSFVDFCSNNGYTVKNGKVISINEEEKKSP